MIEPTVVEVNDEHYLVSTIPLDSAERQMFKMKYETYVFSCDAGGKVADYQEQLSKRHKSVKRAKIYHTRVVNGLREGTLKLQQKMEPETV